MKDKQDSRKMSRSNHKVFVFDPSTHRDGEPIFEVHKDYIEFSRHFPKIKLQAETLKWTLKNFYELYPKLKLTAKPTLNKNSIANSKPL